MEVCCSTHIPTNYMTLFINDNNMFRCAQPVSSFQATAVAQIQAIERCMPVLIQHVRTSVGQMGIGLYLKFLANHIWIPGGWSMAGQL